MNWSRKRWKVVTQMIKQRECMSSFYDWHEEYETTRCKMLYKFKVEFTTQLWPLHVSCKLWFWKTTTLSLCEDDRLLFKIPHKLKQKDAFETPSSVTLFILSKNHSKVHTTLQENSRFQGAHHLNAFCVVWLSGLWDVSG